MNRLPTKQDPIEAIAKELFAKVKQHSKELSTLPEAVFVEMIAKFDHESPEHMDKEVHDLIKGLILKDRFEFISHQ